MSREYPPYPLPGVLALVARDGRVLMVQRSRPPDQGKWGFPGGLIETGETIAEAALRELHEETGLVAEAERVIDVFEVITRDDHGRVRYHFVLDVVLCHWQSGEAVAGDDAAQVGWYGLAEIDDPGLPCSSNVGRLARMVLG